MRKAWFWVFFLSYEGTLSFSSHSVRASSAFLQGVMGRNCVSLLFSESPLEPFILGVEVEMDHEHPLFFFSPPRVASPQAPSPFPSFTHTEGIKKVNKENKNRASGSSFPFPLFSRVRQPRSLFWPH